jgi:hypothetical protein
MRKRTAVEKMAMELNAEIGHYIPHEKLLYIQLIISNAKALEKEQIIEATNAVRTGESYYNAIYGGDK